MTDYRNPFNPVATYANYVADLRTENLIALIEAVTRHQVGLRLPVTQERNIKQLQELQAELFRRCENGES